jgi:DNA-binding beta-propeller fold protein YncE
VAVSPDGKSVYVTSSYAPGRNGAVVRLVRNTTTGAITQPAGTAGCISHTGAGPCADGHALEEPWSVTVSPDGKSVYATSRNNGPEDSAGAVVRLIRNPATGAISQPAGTAGCISSPQVGSADSSWTGCAEGHAVSEGGVTVSPDGKSVYVASYSWSAVARLIRNTTTGAISQPAGAVGCISETGAGLCADGHVLDGALSVAVSPDGKSIYTASYFSDAVARLNRNTTSGAITQPAGTAGCISQTGAGPCADGHGLDGALSVTVSANGKSTYVASLFSNAVARFNRAP